MEKISYLIFVLALGFCFEAGAFVFSTPVSQPVMGVGTKNNPPPFFIDTDSDGIEEGRDNCPGVTNADQKDADQNGVGDDCPVQITGNGKFFCARLDGGKVKCWGDNSQGNLGLWHTQDQSVPSVLAVLNKFKQVEAANSVNRLRTCGIVETADGKSVMCWGAHANSNNDGSYDDRPIPVDGIDHAADLALGDEHLCEATAGGKVFCWGDNDYGQCGQPLSKSFIDTPTAVPGLTNVQKVVAGRVHTCALTEQDEVYCWGGNLQEQLGNGKDNGDPDPNPSYVPNLGAVKNLFALTFMTCANFKDRDTIKCWGTGLGEEEYPDPISVSSFKGAKDFVDIPPFDNCWIQSDETVTCTVSLIGTQGLRSVKHLAGGMGTICALKKDGSVWCSGANTSGQLGNGKTDSTFSENPVKVKF